MVKDCVVAEFDMDAIGRDIDRCIAAQAIEKVCFGLGPVDSPPRTSWPPAVVTVGIKYESRDMKLVQRSPRHWRIDHIGMPNGCFYRICTAGRINRIVYIVGKNG